jgi:hypothetical protein
MSNLNALPRGFALNAEYMPPLPIPTGVAGYAAVYHNKRTRKLARRVIKCFG